MKLAQLPPAWQLLKPVWLSATVDFFLLVWQAEKCPSGTEPQERCGPGSGQVRDLIGLHVPLLQPPSSSSNGLHSPPKDLLLERG